MDAVKAAQEVDHTDSVAQNPDEFGVGFTPEEAATLNGAVYTADQITPELLRKTGFDEELTDEEFERLEAAVSSGVLEQVDESPVALEDIDGIDEDDIERYAEDCELDPEALELLLEWEAANLRAGRTGSDAPGGQELQEELEHLLAINVLAVVNVHSKVNVNADVNLRTDVNVFTNTHIAGVSETLGDG